jgi:hypothetical protein
MKSYFFKYRIQFSKSWNEDEYIDCEITHTMTHCIDGFELINYEIALVIKCTFFKEESNLIATADKVFI